MSALSEGTPYGIDHPLIERKELTQTQKSRPLTVAEYLIFELSAAGVDVLFCSPAVRDAYLTGASQTNLLKSARIMNSPREAAYAAIAYTKDIGIGAFVVEEAELLSLLYDLTLSTDEGIPVVTIIISPSYGENLPGYFIHESAQKRALEQVKTILEGVLGSYVSINDRRTAGARIDRALDVVQQLKLPTMIEITDEVSRSILPTHVYRKTIFNHEEQDLFYSSWETIISRLHHATTPAIAIGKQVRKKTWLMLLARLARKWNAHLFLDPDIAGSLSKLDTGDYTPLVGDNQIATVAFHNHDTLFCFGIESEHGWLQAILEEFSLQEQTCHEVMSVNATSLFFGDGKDPFLIFCLEEFFQSIPSEILIELSKMPQEEKSNDTNIKIAHPIDPLYEMMECFEAGSIFLLDLSPEETERFQTTLQNISIWNKPNHASDNWITATLTGLRMGKHSRVIALASEDPQLLEMISTWWTEEAIRFHYSEVKLALVLVSKHDHANLSSLLQPYFFNKIGLFKEWIHKKSRNSGSSIGVIVMPPIPKQ